MLLTDYDYQLPEDLIAQHPCEPRDHSRLMVLDRDTGTIAHRRFYNLLDYLSPGDTLVFNDTRVIPARLIGHRNGTGGRIEVFLLNRCSTTEWEALVRPGKKLQPGAVVVFSEDLSCEVVAYTVFGGRRVRFRCR